MKLAFCVETLMEGAGITNRDLYRSKVFKKRGHQADMFAFAAREPIPPIDYKLVFGSSFSSKIFRKVSFLAKNRIKETFADYDYIFITSNTNLMRFFDQPGIREKTVVTYSGFAHPYLRLYHGEKLFNRERMCETFFEMAPRFPHLFANSGYTHKELELGGIEHSKRVYNGIDLNIF
jgi:hypothetical protein